jgi:hypothetical protein
MGHRTRGKLDQLDHHCRAWSGKWPDTSRLASYGQIVRDHSGLHSLSGDTLQSLLQRNYETHEWAAGGGDPYADAGLGSDSA